MAPWQSCAGFPCITLVPIIALLIRNGGRGPRQIVWVARGLGAGGSGSGLSEEVKRRGETGIDVRVKSKK